MRRFILSEIKKSRINKDDVKTAIDFLKSQNKKVTTSEIRDFLKVGSFSTISKLMKELEIERENAEMKELEKNAKIESIDPEISKIVQEITENLQLKISEHFEQKIESQDKQLEALKNNLERENQRYNEVNQQLEQSEQSVEELETSKNKSELKLTDLESSFDQRKTELELQYERIFKELDTKTDLLKQKEFEVEQRVKDAIQAEKEKLKTEINRLTHENIALNKEVKELLTKTGDLTAQLLSVSNAHANAQANEKVKESKITELKNELIQIKSENKEERTQLQKKIDDLSKQNADISRKEAILITKNAELEHKNSLFEEEKKRLKKQSEAFTQSKNS